MGEMPRDMTIDMITQTKKDIDRFRTLILIDGEMLIRESIFPEFEKLTRQTDNRAMKAYITATNLLKNKNIENDTAEKYIEQLLAFVDAAENYRLSIEKNAEKYHSPSLHHAVRYARAVHCMAYNVKKHAKL